jgi:hypothetical protein
LSGRAIRKEVLARRHQLKGEHGWVEADPYAYTVRSVEGVLSVHKMATDPQLGLCRTGPDQESSREDG